MKVKFDVTATRYSFKTEIEGVGTVSASLGEGDGFKADGINLEVIYTSAKESSTPPKQAVRLAVVWLGNDIETALPAAEAIVASLIHLKSWEAA